MTSPLRSAFLLLGRQQCAGGGPRLFSNVTGGQRTIPSRAPRDGGPIDGSFAQAFGALQPIMLDARNGFTEQMESIGSSPVCRLTLQMSEWRFRPWVLSD